MIRMWILLVTVLTATTTAVADVQEWFQITLNSTPAGWQHVVESASGDLRTHANVEEMRLARAGTEVKIRSSTVWVDRANGTPVSMTWKQELGGQPVETTWTFETDSVNVRVQQGTRTSVSQQPAPEGIWLTPLAARDFLKQRSEAGANEIVYRTIMPDLGLLPVMQTWKRVGPSVLNILGRPRPVTEWSVTTAGLPVEMSVWISKDWRNVRTTMKAAFGNICSTMTDQTTAQSLHAGPVPELFVSLFVQPTGSIKDFAKADRAQMKLTTVDGEAIRLPSAGGQSVVNEADGQLTIEVAAEGSSEATPAELEDPSYRAASGMINSDDEAIQKLRDVALKPMSADATDALKAETLRRYVTSYITSKGLSTAFATASDAARTRAGDCSEHGVLLAAMLRSAGIPSRVASGLVYMDQINAFGWHMWTQGLIDGRWVDLDATMPRAFSPGHVLVATSAMSDGDGQRELVGLIGLLGNLNIEIVQVD